MSSLIKYCIVCRTLGCSEGEFHFGRPRNTMVGGPYGILKSRHLASRKAPKACFVSCVGLQFIDNTSQIVFINYMIYHLIILPCWRNNVEPNIQYCSSLHLLHILSCFFRLAPFSRPPSSLRHLALQNPQ